MLAKWRTISRGVRQVIIFFRAFHISSKTFNSADVFSVAYYRNVNSTLFHITIIVIAIECLYIVHVHNCIGTAWSWIHWLELNCSFAMLKIVLYLFQEYSISRILSQVYYQHCWSDIFKSTYIIRTKQLLIVLETCEKIEIKPFRTNNYANELQNTLYRSHTAKYMMSCRKNIEFIMNISLFISLVNASLVKFVN